MHILLRDVQELEQLVVEIGQVGHFDKLDMELLYTRIKGVRHLLEVATELKTPPSSNREVPSSNPEPSVHVPEKAASSPAPAEPEQAPRPAVPQEKAVVSSLWNLRPARANNLQLLRKSGRKAPRRKKSISATRKNLTLKNKSWAKNLPPESRYTIS